MELTALTTSHDLFWYIGDDHVACIWHDFFKDDMVGMKVANMDCVRETHHWPLLLTWFNFNPSMEK